MGILALVGLFISLCSLLVFISIVVMLALLLEVLPRLGLDLLVLFLVAEEFSRGTHKYTDRIAFLIQMLHLAILHILLLLSTFVYSFYFSSEH